jgi:L-asparaginase
MRLKIFTTGGTIDKIYFDKKGQYEVGDPQAVGVLDRANVTFDYHVESILKQDSLDMTDADRQLVRRAVEGATEDRIIITHGTDTMVATAKMLEGLAGKTIVLTGSMYPAQFRDSDAVFNLGCAVIAAQTLRHGVYIAMNGQIFDPRTSVKNVDENRFQAMDE